MDLRLTRTTLEEHLLAALSVISPERDALVISRLWGLDRGGGENMRSIATDLGITRERVRQISVRAIDKLRSNAALKAAIFAVIRFAASRAPATAAKIEAELHDLNMTSGELRFGSIIAAALALGIEVPFATTPVGTETIVHDAEISIEPLETAAKVITATNGAAQLRVVMRRAAMRDRRLGRLALARVVLPCCEGFLWLDKTSGWFSLSSVLGNRLFDQIRKVFSVVDQIPVMDLKAAVSRDHRSFRLDLPDSVFRELCRQTPWLAMEGPMVRPRIAIQPEGVLGSTDLGLLRMLRDADAALTHNEIVSRSARYGILAGTALQRLLFSPIIQRYKRATYGLIGSQTSPSTINPM